METACPVMPKRRIHLFPIPCNTAIILSRHFQQSSFLLFSAIHLELCSVLCPFLRHAFAHLFHRFVFFEEVSRTLVRILRYEYEVPEFTLRAIDRNFTTNCLTPSADVYLSIYLSISVYMSYVYDTLYTIYNVCGNKNICGNGKCGSMHILSSTRRSLPSAHAICSGCGFRRYSCFMLLPMLRFVFQMQNKTLDLWIQNDFAEMNVFRKSNYSLEGPDGWVELVCSLEMVSICHNPCSHSNRIGCGAIFFEMQIYGKKTCANCRRFFS